MRLLRRGVYPAVGGAPRNDTWILYNQFYRTASEDRRYEHGARGFIETLRIRYLFSNSDRNGEVIQKRRRVMNEQEKSLWSKDVETK